MRTLFTLAVLGLVAGGASAAERVVATDGTSYTRAADGHLYPSEYVRADGSVGTTPVAATPAPAGAPAPLPPSVYSPPGVVYPSPLFVPFNPTCPNGRCPLPPR